MKYNKKMEKKKIEELNQELQNYSAEDILRYCVEKLNAKICFATSLGAEDQVISSMIYEEKLEQIDIFTLDTGRMFQESYDVLERTIARYKKSIEVVFPDKKEVEDLVNAKGINLFYQSIENRKACCQIRKTNPLQRKLANYDAWIVGLRREQSITRSDLQIVEWDEMHSMIKINPLYNWTEKEVWERIKSKQIPYNKLHDQGFPSIGCAPCTRAIEKGEDVRFGRWWWELPEQKECGLHKS
jgi:phosphoadenosine phosphosulfate reductase